MKQIKIITSPDQNHTTPLSGFSKFWGFPVMPESFDYPSYKDEDGEEAQYDFVCQIDCAEIAQYDSENLLPHTGALYFFARIGAYAGNFWEEALPTGFWRKNGVKVIYTPRTDFENFVEMVLTDEEDHEICYPQKKLALVSAESDTDMIQGHWLLCENAAVRVGMDLKEYVPLLQLDSCMISDETNLKFPGDGKLLFLVPVADLSGTKRTFKNTVGFLSGKE